MKISFNGDNVSFNVDCVLNEDEDEHLPANVEMRIDEISDMDISSEKIRLIPDSIGRLSNLTSLCLAINELVTLPNSIGRLTKLEHLNLEHNRLTTFPLIRRLTKLEHLDLSNNQITSIPRTIENLTNLEELNLRNNLIQSIPKWLGNLNLQRLNLRNNPLTHIPATIGNSRLRSCILPDDIILEPLQEEYLFTNRAVLTEVRRVFDIRKYNKLMEEKMENQNKIDRRPTRSFAKASTKYYTRRSKTSKNRLSSEMKPSSKVFEKNDFISHITGMLGNRYIPKTIDEVIRLS